MSVMHDSFFTGSHWRDVRSFRALSPPHAARRWHHSGDDKEGFWHLRLHIWPSQPWGPLAVVSPSWTLNALLNTLVRRGTPYKWLIHFLFLVLLTSGCVCEACSALMKMFTLYWLLWWHLIAKGHPTVIKETMPRNKRLGQPVLLQSPVTTLQRQEHLSPQARLEPYCPFPCRCALSECAVSQICTGGRWITSVTSVLELEWWPFVQANSEPVYNTLLTHSSLCLSISEKYSSCVLACHYFEKSVNVNTLNNQLVIY